MAALQSGSQPVIESALTHLPEFSVLCQVTNLYQMFSGQRIYWSNFQENLSNLLGTVFSLGITSNINTTPHIVNAVTLLNMQAGYV